MELRPMSESKARFDHLFPIVTTKVLSEYRKQYEEVISTHINTTLDLDSKIELDEKDRIIVRPVRVRAIK
jgi:hypothetical protein